ncbi:hypothetical protein [Salicola sp. Rm-C-2C1-2]
MNSLQVGVATEDIGFVASEVFSMDGSRSESGVGTQHTDVALRLVKSTDD